MFKLNFFRKPKLSCAERREKGYRDAAATLLHTGNQRAVEAMAMGSDSYAAGAYEALRDYHKRRSDVVDKARQALAELEAS